MKINWKLRIQSPQFWMGLVGVIMSPILSYLGLTGSDLTSWGSVAQLGQSFISNPYLICTVIMSILSFVGIVTDPTTKGFCDSCDALEYKTRKDTDKPKEESGKSE